MLSGAEGVGLCEGGLARDVLLCVHAHVRLRLLGSKVRDITPAIHLIADLIVIEGVGLEIIQDDLCGRRVRRGTGS